MHATEPEPTDAPSQASRPRVPRNAIRLGAALGIVVAAFALPLWDLGVYAVHSDLYSHIPLVPCIAGYLLWLRRDEWSSLGPPKARWLALPLLLVVAALLLLARQIPDTAAAHDDALAATTGAFVAAVWAACALVFGGRFVAAAAFPLAFLLFMLPLPALARNAIDTFSQHGSAEVAHALFALIGTPVLRDDLQFRLPGITIEVAPQCSGIHSTLVLFITSLVAGQLFLRSNVRRAVLALAVVPLALLRNGLRIATIGQLCALYGPDMIHSAIHRRGGPYFFAASLVPLSLLLWFLWRSERNARSRPAATVPAPSLPTVS